MDLGETEVHQARAAPRLGIEQDDVRRLQHLEPGGGVVDAILVARVVDDDEIRAALGCGSEAELGVARDLEWLLNSKRWLPYDLEEFPEANESALTYGVPDFSTYSWRNPGDANQIARLIEDTVRRFEPRLAPSSIKVEILPSGDVDDFKLTFRIDALLHVEPVREAVSYDTEMDLESTAIRISRSS